MGSYLGQNFLIDTKVRTYIAEHIAKLYNELGCEALIEIGPGKGAITKLIDTISSNFFVIEKDVSLAQSLRLEALGPKIILGDVLEIDVDKMLESGIGNQESGKKIDTRKTLVVGNLPYYITSPILRKFFGNGEQKYAGGIFMLQDEVGQKLRSDAKKKSYLRWLINYAYTVTYLKGVPGKCFKPIPKVKSCLVELTMNNEKGIMNNVGWNRFIEFLELFAPFSRKTLGAIRTMINKKSGCMFVIPESLKKKRLEELSFEELTQIVK